MNPNDIVKIKPTEVGWQEIVESVDDTNAQLRQYPHLTHRAEVPKADAEGYITGQFWHLMKNFSWSIGKGVPFTDLRPLSKEHPKE